MTTRAGSKAAKRKPSEVDTSHRNVDLVAMAIAVCDEPDPKRAWDEMGRDMRVIYRAHALRFLRALRKP
jgi:hypothetical protein